jgi:hypothetical protein
VNRNWVEALRRERRDGPAAVGGEERAELARLCRRVAELELEKEVLRKPRSSSPGRQTGDPRDHLRVHRREKTTYPVRLLCRVLQVSTSAFYDWIHRGRPAISDTDLDDAYDANQLRDAWAAHRRTYGARRLTAEIRDRGQAWNRKKVARLMTVVRAGS